jgi:hypothetical protein
VFLAVIGDVWLRVCAQLSPQVFRTPSPRTEQLENPPQLQRRHHWVHLLPLSPIGIGRCGTLFARRPRPGAGCGRTA